MDATTPYSVSEQAPGKWASALLTLLMHGLLAALLFFGIRWQSRPIEPVEVELVSARPSAPSPAQPQPAQETQTKTPPTPKAVTPPKEAPPKKAPPPPKPVVKTPPPEPKQPTKPDIAVKKQPPPASKKAPPVKQPPKVEDTEEKEDLQELEKQRLNEMMNRDAERMRQQALLREDSRTLQSSQNQQALSGARARYIDKIRSKIRRNIVLPAGVTGNPEAVFLVEQLPSGEILESSVRLYKSSGNKALDDAIERAILKSSPLPLPERGETFERSLRLPVRPLEETNP